MIDNIVIPTCDESNLDILAYMQKYDVMRYEIADWLKISVRDLNLYFSEPLTNAEKRDIAIIVRKIFDYQYKKYRDEYKTHNAAHKLDKYAEVFSKHCCLKDGPKFTGQRYDYYEGRFYQYAD